MREPHGPWPYFAHLALRSGNQKTGPIPVSTTSKDSCPGRCAFKGNGCYAETGPMAIHWKAVTDRQRGLPWEVFCDAVATLEPMQLWRHNQAGDLPGDGETIDHAALELLLDANVGKRGFTYTHYDPTVPDNAIAIATANLRGLTVNLSANSVHDVDALADLGIGPVVCVLPRDATANVKTPKGRTVVVCPATQRADVTCASCQLCYRQRDAVVGFPAHGSGAKKVEAFSRVDMGRDPTYRPSPNLKGAEERLERSPA